MLAVASISLLASVDAYAFSGTVGLEVGGGAGFGFKPGGASQFFLSAPSYHNDINNPASGTVLTNSTLGNWNDTWRDTYGNMATYSGFAESSAKSSFGSLGVHAYAVVSEKDASTNTPNNYYDWETNASSAAAFYDVWNVNAGAVNGSTGTLTVHIDLEGSGTDSWDNHVAELSMGLVNYGHGGTVSTGPLRTERAGGYDLTIPFLYGANNNISMSMIAGVSSFNRYSGGGVASVLDFYDTATISGLTFKDEQGGIISDYSMITGSGYNYLPSAEPVPEPGTIALLGLGMAGLAIYGKRRQKKA